MEYAVVLFETDTAFQEQLKKCLQGITIIFNENNDPNRIDPKIVQNTSIIFGNPSADFLKRCPQLKWVQLQSAGTDGFVSGEIGEQVLLTSATGGYGHSVSEHMVALTFTLCKKLHLYRDEQHKEHWQSRGNVKSIQGSVVLVIGMGDIGNAYARRMKALGCYIIGIRRTSHPKPDYVDEMFLSDELDQTLPRADIVALIVPGVKANAGLISRERIAKMKPGAIIINAGRGSAIDTEALCDALESGRLDGAGMDVTDPEPLPPGHRLWKTENALITPHIAGGRYMSETYQYIMKLNLENASRFMRGEPLESVIDMKTGYRIPHT